VKCLTLAVALLTAGAFVAWPRADRITPENCDRIGEGMTVAEVEAILGPPGDYRSVPSFAPVFSVHYSETIQETWQGNEGCIQVDFLDGRVLPASYYAGVRLEWGPLDVLLWRAERQWRRWFPEKPEGRP
jgi:hypothetical protein